MNITEIQKLIPKENIYVNEPMSKHTSFKIGGPAECFIKIKTIEQLKDILKYAQKEKIPLTIIKIESKSNKTPTNKFVRYSTFPKPNG